MVNWKLYECLVILEATTGNEADLEIRNERRSVCIRNYVLIAVVNFSKGFHPKNLSFPNTFWKLRFGPSRWSIEISFEMWWHHFFVFWKTPAVSIALSPWCICLFVSDSWPGENAKYVNNNYFYVRKLNFLHIYESSEATLLYLTMTNQWKYGVSWFSHRNLDNPKMPRKYSEFDIFLHFCKINRFFVIGRKSRIIQLYCYFVGIQTHNSLEFFCKITLVGQVSS